MSDRLRIAIVDDEPIVCREIERTLAKEPFIVKSFSNGPDALAELRASGFDIVVSDLRMPEMDGMEVLREVNAASPRTEVIIATAHSSVDTAIEALQAGAYHYITKPIKRAELRTLIRRAADKVLLVRDRDALRSALESSQRPENMIGTSASMRELFRLIDKVAPLDCNVLIQGESGTGKEMVARAIHKRGSRRDRPFVSFNCGGFTEELISNELFGHERGAYTGATSTKIGLLQAAHQGTVFLDEVEAMPISMQVKLLRFIEERRLIRVGGVTPIEVDVRLLAAGNRDLKKLIQEERFREDLFFRLNVVAIHLPPLRERTGDLALLVRHFLAKYSGAFEREVHGLSEKAMALLAAYPFPGNVRELENIIERAVALCDGSTVEVHDLPPEIQDGARIESSPDSWPTLVEHERTYIQEVLRRTGNSRSKAAEILDIPRTTLWRKLKRLGLD